MSPPTLGANFSTRSGYNHPSSLWMPQGNVWVTEGLYPNSPYHFKSQSHPSAAASSAGARDGADRDARHDADSLHGGGAGRV